MTLDVPRRSILALLAVGLCLVLAACGSSSSSSSSETEGTTASSSEGSSGGEAGAAKKGLLTIADTEVANSLDPDGPSAAVKANINAINNTYDNLVAFKSAPNPESLGGGETIDASGVEPALATSWKAAGDGVTFNLRHGVKDQYGNEMTSEDVVWSYERAMGLEATGAFIYGVEAGITGVKPEGKYKVHYTTEGERPLLPWALIAHYATIYDAKEVKAHATSKDPWAAKWLSTHTAGFGAYEVSSYTPGQSLDLKPFKGYWQGPAENAIDLVAIPDASNSLAALEKGNVNLALNLSPEQLSQAKGDSELHVYAVEGNSLVSMFPNADVKELDNPLVRQALQYATPQEEIVSQIYKGFGFPIESVATPYSTGYTNKFWHYTYDPSKAKELMKEAGYPNGFSSELFYPSDSPTLSTLAPILQSAYEEIGIKVKLVGQPATNLITRAFGSKDLPMYLTDQASSVLPDIGNIGALYQTEGFANINGYSNEEFDKAAETALSTNDTAKRMKAFEEMQKVTAEDPVYTAVAGIDGTAAASANVEGYWWLPDQSTVFRTLTVGSGS